MNKLYGTKYVIYNFCIIAVDAEFVSRMPVFGKLENIEFSPLKTLGIHGDLIAYKVAEPLPDDVTKFCHFKRLLDYNVY